jgi:hypothetical protein
MPCIRRAGKRATGNPIALVSFHPRRIKVDTQGPG